MLLYDFPDHYKGDYWEGVPSIILKRNDVPVDLTNAIVRMQFKLRATAEPVLELSTTNGGIVIISAAGGEISIIGRNLDIFAQTYHYDLQYIIPSIATDYTQTVLAGKLKVISDITY